MQERIQDGTNSWNRGFWLPPQPSSPRDNDTQDSEPRTIPSKTTTETVAALHRSEDAA